MMKYISRKCYYIMVNNYLVDNPSRLVQIVFSIMIISLNRCLKFLTRLISISKLASAFLFGQTELTVQAITSVPINVKTIACDGN